MVGELSFVDTWGCCFLTPFSVGKDNVGIMAGDVLIFIALGRLWRLRTIF